VKTKAREAKSGATAAKMAGKSIFKKRIAFIPKKKEKPSAYSTWKKNEKTGILEAICVRCHRKFVAYHASQLHMVAPSTGECYYCRSHMHEQIRKPRANDAVCDERLFEDIEHAHQGRWLRQQTVGVFDRIIALLQENSPPALVMLLWRRTKA